MPELSDSQRRKLVELEHKWRAQRPRFVVHWRNGNIKVMGFIADGVAHLISEAPERVLSYLVQAIDGRPTQYWLADCWA
jgi:hypothetical protein